MYLNELIISVIAIVILYIFIIILYFFYNILTNFNNNTLVGDSRENLNIALRCHIKIIVSLIRLENELFKSKL